MSEVPHPFISETAAVFEGASKSEKSKIVFIHFNHSNPALNENNAARKALENDGFKFAKQGDRFVL